MPTSKITTKGQVTIPKEVREFMGLETGHRIAFYLRPDGIVEMRKESVDLLDLAGIVKPQVRGVTVEDMNQAIRQTAGGKRGER